MSAPAVAAGPLPRALRAELKIEPTFTIENLVQSPLVEVLEDAGVVERARATRETVFELIFALDVPTTVPRVGLTSKGFSSRSELSTLTRPCAWWGAVRGRRQSLVTILRLRGTARTSGALTW